jgi:hypothetical protein
LGVGFGNLGFIGCPETKGFIKLFFGKALEDDNDPSSFSILVTGVPAKLFETANISVKNSLLVSRFFSSN